MVGSSPEHKKAWSKKYNARPEVKAAAKARRQTPEYKAVKNVRQKTRRAVPEVKAQRKAYQQRYVADPKVSASRENARLKYKYGITLDDYNAMFKAQGGCCAICGIRQAEGGRALAVDHNHVTGDVRGLLCVSCNTAIGKLGADDGIEILTKAIDYLMR